jgi:hypothetical protein
LQEDFELEVCEIRNDTLMKLPTLATDQHGSRNGILFCRFLPAARRCWIAADHDMVLCYYRKAADAGSALPPSPAKLPARDGKLQWFKARLANVPPEKPSEVMINQLAKARLLDPATGQGLPGSPAFSQSHLSAPNCYSGQVCPVSGDWKVGWLPVSPQFL